MTNILGFIGSVLIILQLGLLSHGFDSALVLVTGLSAVYNISSSFERVFLSLSYSKNSTLYISSRNFVME